jgi:hypothetical protein
MMKKIDNHQLELFSQAEADADTRGWEDKKNPLLDYIWSNEKTILIIIAFIVVGIISFSLGVVKGKRLSTLKNDSYLDLALKTESGVSGPISNNKPEYKPHSFNEGGTDSGEPIQPAVKKDAIKEDAVKQDVLKESSQGYTVQIASYQTKTLAKKEAEILKGIGFLPLILAKGKYTILCIGNFRNKEMAKPLLSKLKKRYQDCFIRRL